MVSWNTVTVSATSGRALGENFCLVGLPKLTPGFLCSHIF